MHLSKFTIAFVVVAATGAFSSPTFNPTSPSIPICNHPAPQSPVDMGAFSDIPEIDPDEEVEVEAFSRRPLTSLEAESFYKFCFLGKCRHRHYKHQRCPEGSRVVAFRRCGRTWWWVRAICCPWRHEEDCIKSFEELGDDDIKTYDQLELLD